MSTHHKVLIQPSGKFFSADEGSTLLDAAVNENINLAYSCRNGSCGICKSRLIKGIVDQPENLEGISDNDIKQGYILTCVSKAMSDVEIESTYYSELTDIKAVISPCKIAKTEFPNDDVAILYLRLPPKNNFKYLPGQYIDLIWKDVRRSYSIANSEPCEFGLELHIRYIPNGIFSRLVFERLKPGDLLRLHGPYGTFFIRDAISPIIFLAGGTGFAPIKAMVEELIVKKSERLIYIYWGSRNKNDFYSDLPKKWDLKYANITFVPVVSDSFDGWQGRTGLVHKAVMNDHLDLTSFQVYACGSQKMINAAKNDFTKNGLLQNNFFADVFTPSIEKNY